MEKFKTNTGPGTEAMKAAALHYQKQGFSVIPVGKNKKSLVSWKKYELERATLEQIEKWFKKWPNMNLSIVTGAISGFVVLDLDSKHSWSSKRLSELGFNIPLTAMAKTGNNGEHYLFKHPSENIPNSEGQLFGEGVDIRGDGGYIVVEPSVTAYKDKDGKDAGGAYTWTIPPEDGIADMPEWLLSKIKGKDKNKHDWRSLLTQDAPEGMRNGVATKIAGGLLRTTNQKQWDKKVWPKLQSWNTEYCKPLLSEEELRAVYDSISGAEQERLDDLPEEEEKQAQKMELMELVTSNPETELFRDNYGNGCARVVVDGHKEIMVCSGKRFGQWLGLSYLEQYGNIADPTAVKTAINAIESLAVFKGKEYKLYNRVAKVGDTVWLDLADERNRAVQITATGWVIVDEPPILFRRHAHQKEQVEPQRGGDINKLFDFVKVTDSPQRLLLLVYLASCFVPNFPHVLLYVHGEQGSSKSTFFKILRMLVDPSRTAVIHMPKDERELKLQLSRHHLVFYDNVDGISDAISAVLCIGVTGGSSSERLYFTNGEDFIFDFQLNIGLNGINISAVKPDLLERSLLFGLKHVGNIERKDEEELYESFEKERPKILGAILDTVVKALAIRPSVKLASKPRMADFSLWGVAIAEALGHTREEFLDAYGSKITEQSDEALETSTEATTLIRFMDDKSEWHGEPSHLLAELKKTIANNDAEFGYGEELPKKASQLMKNLNILKPNLRTVGYDLSRKKINGRRIIFIRKRNIKAVPSVQAVPSATPNNESEEDMETTQGQNTSLQPSTAELGPYSMDGRDGADDIKTEDASFQQNNF